MAGISSKALSNTPVNKRKFNDGSELASIEFFDGSGIELYSTDFRSYDPQIGRFIQKDPLGEWTESWSLYAFAYNNPILFNDPLGLSNDTTTLPEIVIPGGPAPPPKCLHCGISPVVPGSDSFSPSLERTTPPLFKSDELPAGEDITKWEDWVYQLNSFNPFASAVNSLWIYFTGKDTYGATQDNYAATAQALGAIAFTRVVSAPATAVKSIWTATKSKSAVRNAFKHWKDHGKEFPELFNSKQYVEAARKFLHNSPEGTLVKVRPNGDVLKYHQDTNTFGVMDANGTPRTMFKPNDGMAYWMKQ